MAGTGALERAVLGVLWDAAGSLAARDVLAGLARRDGEPRELAVTTVLTVLDRLGRKGLVRRERSGRAHLYQAAVSSIAQSPGPPGPAGSGAASPPRARRR